MKFKLWENKLQKVNKLIDGDKFILFFKHKNKIFGAPEESRIVFARMKNPDSDMPKNWEDDASFSAFDLIKSLSGDSVENLFSMNDLPEIDVITRNEVENSLMKAPCVPQTPATISVKPISKFGANTIALKDRK